MMGNFSKFTNLYPVTKTLRRELKPIGNTLEFMKKDQGVLQKDLKRGENYVLIKPILDKLHNDFIVESLEISEIDWSSFYTYYIEYKKAIQNRKLLSEKEKKNLEEEFGSLKKRLRKDVGLLYDEIANKWKIKYKDDKGNILLKANGYKILTEVGIQKVLEIKYKDDEESLKIIKGFSGFWTYFTGFNQNRENYYTIEGKSTEIAFRIVDQNLITFCNNALLKDNIKAIGLSKEEEKVFDINYYNYCLTQEGIDTYNYVLGGQIDENGKRISNGLNQRINEYNQKNKTKIPQLTILYKQIGSIKEKWKLFDFVEDDMHLFKLFDEHIGLCENQLSEIKLVVEDFFNNQQDLEKIWISKTNLNWISNRFFANWTSINDKGLELKIFDKRKDSNKGEQIKIPEYISFLDLKNILKNIQIEDQQDLDEEKRVLLFKKEFEQQRNGEKDNWNFFVNLLKKHWESVSEELLVSTKNEFKTILNVFDKTNQEHKNIVKGFADSTLDILRFMKLFRVDPSKWQEDISDFNKGIDTLIQGFTVSSYYDLIRNYLTKKPFSIEKIKLNFDCSTLLDGWDKNKETQNLSVILKDEKGYYLAIAKKDNNRFFEEKNTKLYDVSGNVELIQKMEYKLLPGPNKMLPKCLMPGKDPKKYGASDDILYTYKKGNFKKGPDFDKKSLSKMIDFFKGGLKRYKDWQIFDFVFQDTESYEDISKFYAEVEKQGYKVSWENINKQELYRAIDNGELFLFQISSKDFTKKNKESKQDLQTIYRTSMLNGNSNIKLNGGAEMFFRPASIKKKSQKNLKIKNDNAIESKRYTEDKILFHCPITLNFGSQKITKFNDFTNNYLRNNGSINIIGIDRGEKHLNFYSVINQKGEILEQGTLNIIENSYRDKNGKEYTKFVDYGELLEKNAGNRLHARQNWEEIGKIKELKEGYLSQVVKKISDLVLKYNAVVVLENLNTGFKNSRKKIDKSVYQNLEVALAKKLSFLVDKNVENGLMGSVINPYQLCPVTGVFSDIERATQWGIMFYTRANYTSTTDPITGWRKTIYLKKGKKEDIEKSIEEKFESIGFDKSKQSYFIKYEKWILRSDVERRRGKKDIHGQRQTTKYNPTEELNKLFKKYGIEKNGDVLNQIKSKTANLSAGFYTSLIRIIDLIMQIRNSDKDGNDFILSCVEDKNGKKFDSREYYKLTDQEFSNKVKYPTSGDANGAYNIARKGIIMLDKINKGENKLFVSDDERDKRQQENS